MAKKKGLDVTDDMLPPGKELELGEIGHPGGIERVSENDFANTAELEAFMNEKIKIVVHESQIEGALEIITPTVNQLNQPIVRGVASWVKRKYVEALARGRDTKLDQIMDPYQKERIKNVQKSILSYPFSVIEDRNPNGREWLKSIAAEA